MSTLTFWQNQLRLILRLRLVFLMSPLSLAEKPWFDRVGDLPGGAVASIAYGISSDGRVVVGEASSQGQYFNEAFIWTRDEGIKGVGDMNGGNQIGSGFLAAGGDGTYCVGASQNDESEWGEAVRWSEKDGFVGLGDLPGNERFSSAFDVSRDGNVVVGISTSQRTNNGNYEAFRWTPESGMTDLGDFPNGTYAGNARAVSGDGRYIAGGGVGDHGFGEAYRWSEETGIVGLGQLGKGTGTAAFGMSDDGKYIVGQANGKRGDGTVQAFLWSESDGMVGLGWLGSLKLSVATDVSDDGRVVVGYDYLSSGTIAWIWDAEHGIRAIATLLDRELDIHDQKKWALEVSTAVSADGLTIVGKGRNPKGNYEGWVVHIPEPSTAALALALLALIRRREEPTSTGRSRERRGYR